MTEIEEHHLVDGASRRPGKRVEFRTGESALFQRLPLAVRAQSEAWSVALPQLFCETRFQIHNLESVEGAKAGEEGLPCNAPVLIWEFDAQRDLQSLAGIAKKVIWQDAAFRIVLLSNASQLATEDRSILRNLLSRQGAARVVESIGERFNLRTAVERYVQTCWEPEIGEIEQRVEANFPW